MNSKIIFVLFSLVGPVFCGPEGYFVLENNTPYDFELMGISSLQIYGWKFPATIRANSKARVWLEFSHYLFYNWKRARATVVYRLKGPGLTFTIDAIHTAVDGSKPDIVVTFHNFANLGRSVSNGNWKEDQESVFDLSYDPGSNKFYSKTMHSQLPITR